MWKLALDDSKEVPALSNDPVRLLLSLEHYLHVLMQFLGLQDIIIDKEILIVGLDYGRYWLN